MPPTEGTIWRAGASAKDSALAVEANRLGDQGMTAHGLALRVASLGESIGIDTLSPHDCRHYWATKASRNRTPLDRLQDAGGWSSPAMPLRYIQSAAIANEGGRY